MPGRADLGSVVPDHIFDGGDLDCGSGLVLLIRENMRQVPPGGVLEMRSREATVGDDLPPWCRMAGHEYLGTLPGDGFVRYFVRRGAAEAAMKETQQLEADKNRARQYEWKVRVRSTGALRSTAYCRNFSFDIGQPASFEEKDANPSAVEFLLASLAGSLSAGLATECARDGLNVDDIEISVKGRLRNVLAHLGVEDGDPSLETIELKCFVTTGESEPRVRGAWDRAVARSPLAATLGRAVALDLKLALV